MMSAWFTCLSRHPTRKQSGSILTHGTHMEQQLWPATLWQITQVACIRQHWSSSKTHILHKLSVGQHRKVIEHIVNTYICQLFINKITHTTTETNSITDLSVTSDAELTIIGATLTPPPKKKQNPPSNCSSGIPGSNHSTNTHCHIKYYNIKFTITIIFKYTIKGFVTVT